MIEYVSFCINLVETCLKWCNFSTLRQPKNCIRPSLLEKAALLGCVSMMIKMHLGLSNSHIQQNHFEIVPLLLIADI